MNKCPVCYSSKSTIHLILDEGFLRKCRKCNLVFTDIGDKKALLNTNKRNYDDKYRNNYLEKFMDFEPRLRKRTIEIESRSAGGYLLDIGCGTGHFLKYMDNNSSKRWVLFGLDINKRNVENAKSITKAKIIKATVKQASFKSNYFDVITCFDVLEHDLHIITTLIEIQRILKPNGLLVVQVPNHRSIMAKLSGKMWDWWLVPDHVIHFTVNTISHVLIQSGFVVDKIKTWEDKKDFVLNVSGSIKKRVTRNFQLNRILGKITYQILIRTYSIFSLLNEKCKTGGLILIYAYKK